MIGLIGKLAGWKGYAAAAVAGAVIAAGGAWTIQGWRYGAQIADIERDHAAQIAAQGRAANEAMQAVLAEEQRRYAALEIVRDNAEKMAKAAAADAATRAADERRLRDRINALAADAKRRHPTLAEGGPTAGAAVDLLAYMLGRLGQAAGQIAEHGDAARGAGLTCEASYDGVRAGQ